MPSNKKKRKIIEVGRIEERLWDKLCMEAYSPGNEMMYLIFCKM